MLGTSFNWIFKKDENDNFKRLNPDTVLEVSCKAKRLFKSDNFAPEILENIRKRNTKKKFAMQVHLEGKDTFFMAQDVAKVLI